MNGKVCIMLVGEILKAPLVTRQLVHARLGRYVVRRPLALPVCLALLLRDGLLHSLEERAQYNALFAICHIGSYFQARGQHGALVRRFMEQACGVVARALSQRTVYASAPLSTTDAEYGAALDALASSQVIREFVCTEFLELLGLQCPLSRAALLHTPAVQIYLQKSELARQAREQERREGMASFSRELADRNATLGAALAALKHALRDTCDAARALFQTVVGSRDIAAFFALQPCGYNDLLPVSCHASCPDPDEVDFGPAMEAYKHVLLCGSAALDDEGPATSGPATGLSTEPACSSATVGDLRRRCCERMFPGNALHMDSYFQRLTAMYATMAPVPRPFRLPGKHRVSAAIRTRMQWRHGRDAFGLKSDCPRGSSTLYGCLHAFLTESPSFYFHLSKHSLRGAIRRTLDCEQAAHTQARACDSAVRSAQDFLQQRFCSAEDVAFLGSAPPASDDDRLRELAPRLTTLGLLVSAFRLLLERLASYEALSACLCRLDAPGGGGGPGE